VLNDPESVRRFERVELGEDTVPDESMILRFRHLLEPHQLTAAMFEAVKALLTAQRLLLTAGTIVYATIIAAPNPTKHATKTRVPEMQQTQSTAPARGYARRWSIPGSVRRGTRQRTPLGSVIPPVANAESEDIFRTAAFNHLFRASPGYGRRALLEAE